MIQKRLYDSFGIRVDQVLQGHGTTNTGNLARKCFDQAEKFANCLGLNKTFIKSILTILSLFKCKMTLDLDLLEKYSWKIDWLHYELYPWALMNPSLHKLFRHGCQIARKFPLPMAYYSEDASESWHKFYRKNMKSHARQVNSHLVS